MGDRLGIQGAVGFIFTLLTVTGALILPGQEPTSCPSLPCTLVNTLAELKTASTPWRSSKQLLDSQLNSQVSTATPR